MHPYFVLAPCSCDASVPRMTLHFGIRLSGLLAVLLNISYRAFGKLITSSYLGFLIFEMEIIIIFTSKCCHQSKYLTCVHKYSESALHN
jgi:hypothetical protein